MIYLKCSHVCRTVYQCIRFVSFFSVEHIHILMDSKHSRCFASIFFCIKMLSVLDIFSINSLQSPFRFLVTKHTIVISGYYLSAFRYFSALFTFPYLSG